MKCLIVGGGIAGLCLAKALRDIDAQVDLLELNEKWAVYGVGIIQQSNVIRAMAHLGLLEQYLDVSSPFEQVRLFEADGSPRATIPLPRLAGPQYPASLGVSRLALHNVLLAAARASGANIRNGLSVERLENIDDHVDVTLSDTTHATYDLVVGCDGAHSCVRRLMLGEDLRPRFTGQGVWRYNIPRPDEANYLGVYYGPNGNAGIVPMSKDLSYIFVTTTEDPTKRVPHDDLAAQMRKRLEDFGGPVAAIRDTITDNNLVVYRPLETIFAPVWNKGRILILGDAAHTMTPHLGQGAGMAIEDTVVLREELANERPIEDQIAAFLERRVERCRRVTHLSVQTGEWELDNSHHGERMGMMREVQELTAQPI